MPYAPMVTPQPIRADLSGWGNALMQLLGEKRDKEARAAEQAKKEASDFKTYKAMWKTMGGDPNVAEPKDLETVKGMVEGVITKNTLQKGLEEWKAMQADNEANSALAAAVKQAGTKSFPASKIPMLGVPGQPVSMLDMPATTVKQPMTSQTLLDAIAANPNAINARGAMSLLERGLEERGGGTMPIATKVGGRDLIVNPKSGAFQDVTQQAAPKLPEGFVPIAATEDDEGRLQIRYGIPKAEGKALTQTEVAGIAALNQAEMDLNVLEKIYTELGPDYGGPVSGRVKSMAMGGQNPNIAALDNAITAATPNLARGVFREVGVLTDQDVARYKQLLPAPTDTQEVRTRKIKQLRDRIAQGRKEMVTSLKTAGRDVEGFDKGEGAAPNRFDSEAAARSGGAKAGDIIELYDPGTATYRKARLK